MKPLLLAAALCLTACQKKAPPPRIYDVYKDGRKVLFLRSGPGVLTSSSLPDPKRPPVLHPFLWASALDPREEGRLRELLDQSKSFDEYLDKLKAAGYEPKPQ